jgi:putative ABC transport system permease protein
VANEQAIIDEIHATKGLQDFPVQTMDEWLSQMTPQNLPGFNLALYIVTSIAVVVGFLVIFQSMYTAVLERTREIGILKAVGGSSGLILNLLFRETLLLALIGSALGIALTYVTQWMMKHSVPASLVQETVYGWWPIATGIAVAGALLGAIMPGLKAVRQDVTEALSYE